VTPISTGVITTITTAQMPPDLRAAVDSVLQQNVVLTRENEMLRERVVSIQEATDAAIIDLRESFESEILNHEAEKMSLREEVRALDDALGASQDEADAWEKAAKTSVWRRAGGAIIVGAAAIGLDRLINR
jgi:regulator of replication initiation timing